ncbi:MAG: phosphatase PAP2 family protein [Spirochaetes bacterium]|nr:phosphatase PAP2 family protein [Spirochaetota bacterium]
MLRSTKNIVVINLLIIIILIFVLTVPAYPEKTPEPDREIKAPIPLEVKGIIPFRTDRYRYPNTVLLPRAFSSLAACTLAFLEWDGYDWLTAGGVAASTAAFMVPVRGLSADTRFYYWFRDTRDERMQFLFPHIDTNAWVCVIASWTVFFYGSGWISKNKRILEYISLTLEAIGLTQLYHVTAKLLIGREGPTQGNGRGVIWGPRRGISLMPEGTPSGHIATLYAITTVTAEYFDSWPLRILSHVAGVYYAINLMYNNQHFISDILWGASMGYFVAQWVVKNRSTRYTYTQNHTVSGIRVKEAGPEQQGEVLFTPIFNTNTKKIGFSLSYIF